MVQTGFAREEVFVEQFFRHLGGYPVYEKGLLDIRKQVAARTLFGKIEVLARRGISADWQASSLTFARAVARIRPSSGCSSVR